MTQESLFGPPAVARKTDPETSHEAAATVDTFKGANDLDLGLTDNQAAVYLFLQDQSLTDEELVVEYEKRIPRTPDAAAISVGTSDSPRGAARPRVRVARRLPLH